MLYQPSRNTKNAQKKAMSIAIEQVEDKSRVLLEGAIDIAVADELKKALLDAVAAGSPVLLELAGATYLDITAAQILWAVQQEAAARRTTVVFAQPIPEAIISTLAEAGLEQVLATQGRLQERCAE